MEGESAVQDVYMLEKYPSKVPMKKRRNGNGICDEADRNSSYIIIGYK